MKSMRISLAIIMLTVAHAHSLTEFETDSILFMKQEEKLAYDVYTLLYEQWGQRVFSNIAQSEAQHVAAVDSLIAKFGLEDTSSSEPGRFTIPSLQALYEDLITKGKASLIDALLVGRMIEITDIADLTKAIESSEDASVTTVFTSLRKGSENHLRAFSSNLAPLYTPLTKPDLDLQFDSDGHPILSWSDDGAQEVKIRIDRQEASLGWQELETLSTGTTSYTDSTCGVGVTTYRVVVLSSHEAVASEATSCLRPFADYTSWASHVFGDALDTTATRLADPDRDGISNIEEYVNGSHPLAPNASSISLAPMEGNRFSLVTHRRDHMTDVNMRFGASGDLTTWEELEVNVESIATICLGLEQVSSFVEIAPVQKRFVRLEIF